MKTRNRLAVTWIVLLLSLITLSPAAAAELNSTSQQTSGRGYEGSLTVGVTLYVNPSHSSANDSNPGTAADRPLRTIARANSLALANKRNNVGTRILIAPGSYREYIYYSGASGNAPIIYEAQQAGTVTLMGSDLWSSGWTQSGSNWYRSWPFDWGAGPNPWTSYNVTMTEIVRRRELVYVNGQRMTPVLSLNAMTTGSFYADQGGNRLYLRPQSGVNPNGAAVEVATRNIVLDVRNSNNIVIRGINFRYAANNVLGAAVMFGDTTNILIEDSSFHDNSWSGLDFQRVRNVTVRRSAANGNGIRGMGIHTAKYVIFEDTENSYNNWRGAMGNFYGWDSGQKYLFVHDAVFTRYRAVGNLAIGLWLDYNNENFIIDQAYLSDNYLAGMFLEATTGPVIVRNSTICDNRKNPGDNSYYNAGVFITGSDNVTLEANTICNNEGAQIRILGPYNRSGTDWEDGKSFTTQSNNLVVRGNTISADNSADLLVSTISHPSLSTSTYQNNRFSHPYKSNPFRVDYDMNLSSFEGRVGTKSGNTFGGVSTAPTSTPRPTNTPPPAPTAVPTQPPAAPPQAGVRVTNGLQALYQFNEGKGSVVADTSGVGTPMNLTISNTGAVTWGSSGLTLNSETIVRTSGAATKFITAARGSNAITIEMWVRPSAAQQGNTAPRIISLSADGNNRNFSLTHGVWQSAQPLATYDMRTRTSSTDANGLPSFGTPNNSLTTSLQHVVYTFSNGVGTLYINGVQQAQRNIGGNLSTWNTTMALALGNEFTGGRAWRGTYRLVALYSRALTVTEITHNYNLMNGGVVTVPTNTPTSAPTNTPLPTSTPTSQPVNNATRVTSGLQVLYTFNDGRGSTVADVSGVGSPMNLTINNTGAVAWGTGGLTVNSETIIRSSGSASKVITAARSSNALTIELWVRPAAAQQGNTAPRIITLSSDGTNRNFSLTHGVWQSAQPLASYDMRLRTSRTDGNGLPSFGTPNNSLTTNLQHVVFTFSNGVGTLFINGVQQAQRNIGGDLSNWNTTMALALGNEFTGGRAWRGTYRLVAIYGRALSSAEITQNYNAGGAHQGGQAVAAAPTIVPPTATFTPTNTPVPPTATFTPTNTPTNTPVPPTATFTPTNTPTNTPVPPTATFTPTNTPTNTPVPPTATFTPTNTPTNTPVPPTNTPTAQPVSSTGRVANGLQTLYTFDEGSGSVIYDVAGVAAPLNLGIADASAVTWVNGGLTVNRSTIITTGNPVSTLPQAIKASNEVTIEAWVSPTVAQQSGPARIVTLSSDHYNRNFTLGMGNWNGTASGNYDVRLRSTGSDTNGLPSMGANPGALATSTAHVVFTRSADGTERMYINGVEITSRTVRGNLSNWADNFRLALGNELTGDRPWLGTFYLVAIYSRALNTTEVSQNFMAGAGTTGGVQVAAAQPITSQAVTAPETNAAQAAPVVAAPVVEPTAVPAVTEAVVQPEQPVDSSLGAGAPAPAVVATTEPTMVPTFTPAPTLTPMLLPVYATFDVSTPDWVPAGSWSLSASAANGGMGQGWLALPTGTPSTLTWTQPLDLRTAVRPVLTFQSWFAGSYSGLIEVSNDGVNWAFLNMFAPVTQSVWEDTRISLEAYRGTVIWLRWSYLPGTQQVVQGDMWMLDNVSIVDMPLVDSDADGFTDDVDLCPAVAGAVNGCPADTDADGFTDDLDVCPAVAGAVNGCPADTDADGFTDDVDVCPAEAGIGTVDGCPVAAADSDGDGFVDGLDACPTVVGAANGCPDDLDGDGTTDALDFCPEQPGTNNGCPADTDGDGFTDDVDLCVAVVGAESGCPPGDPALAMLTPEATAEPNAGS